MVNGAATRFPAHGQSVVIRPYRKTLLADCGEAMQPRVLGFIHHTHPAAAQLLDDAVMRDGLADHALTC